MKLAKNRTEMVLSLINRRTPRAFDGTCVYSRDVNGGRAIGCQLTVKNSRILSEMGAIEDPAVFELFPARIKKMGKDFLYEVQLIHDMNHNWLKKPDETGNVWNRGGKRKINNLILKYKLKIELLKL